MTESVVEHIGFFEIVELFFFAEPGGGAEASENHELEKQAVGNEAGDGIDLPAGVSEEVFVDILEEGDAVGTKAEGLQPGGEMVVGEGLDSG